MLWHDLGVINKNSGGHPDIEKFYHRVKWDKPRFMGCLLYMNKQQYTFFSQVVIDSPDSNVLLINFHIESFRFAQLTFH